ncbi:MAG TPA: hypothetical protein VIT85_07210 [Solirubrobacterales bacterium]
MLVVETLSAVASPSRRRRRTRAEQAGSGPPEVPLGRVTAVRASEPFDGEEEAQRWLRDTIASEEVTDALLEEGIALLNRALHAQAAAGLDPLPRQLTPRAALLARIGFGTGEEVAKSRFTLAERIDVHASGASRRRMREEELRPQERVAAVLGGRERIDACETLVLRARADLDAGREREAALQLRVGLEAMLVELDGALADPGHGEDMGELTDRRKAVGEAANEALTGDLDPERTGEIEATVVIAERILRRRRVLRGG